jgi:hypothetical protein
MAMMVLLVQPSFWVMCRVPAGGQQRSARGRPAPLLAPVSAGALAQLPSAPTCGEDGKAAGAHIQLGQPQGLVEGVVVVPVSGSGGGVGGSGAVMSPLL